MLRSMTGFGRYYLEENGYSQTWELRSVNSRHLDIKWRLPYSVRSLEAGFERVVRSCASRGRVEISLNLQVSSTSESFVSFNEAQANSMLDAMTIFAESRGDSFIPDYNRLLGLTSLWENSDLDMEGELGSSLEKGLRLALEDWNESRTSEAVALEKDLLARLVTMHDWTSTIEERAPEIKEERFAVLRERLADGLAEHDLVLDESRFLQEITILLDKLDVSEEITRLKAHMARMRELLRQGGDAGRRLDFTIQECFREINTCGNKIQDSQMSRLVVDFKNELEKCREQVQNLE